ncbi:uncharacterized protein LOC8279618 isoform X2 [Ricinus communis]|uniref:uncharacterized protein LOC8279618 isoform X2 n=1 Tax=Ricinus communis TaxID=3988 RepID=UPI00201AB521|nr:uncharacterized protein LOC8279618 isoform X2 [Ricinus communis]
MQMCSLKSFCIQSTQLFPLSINSLPKVINTSAFLRQSLPQICIHNNFKLRAVLSTEEVPPNAARRRSDPQWRGGFSLGIDLGLSRTGLAISKGFSFKPLTVLELRGQKLETRLLEIAEDEETSQCNKVRSVAGRIAVRAAERGWRVYLQDEHGTSTDATYWMINVGLSKGARQKSIDAYAAVVCNEMLFPLIRRLLFTVTFWLQMVLERYYAASGEGTELVIPKQLDLQDKLRKGPPKDIDFYPE